MTKKLVAVLGSIVALFILAAVDTDVLATAGIGGASPWPNIDIGNVGLVGSTSFSDGTFFISGAGSDIWDTSDSFHFTYQAMRGDGEIRVLVTHIDNTDEFAKAGIMLRQTLDPGSAHVILDIKPDGGIEFMRRLFSACCGNDTAFIAGGSATLPVWLKLRREGFIITAQMAPTCCDSWTTIGTTSLGWSGLAFAGLAVTSHNPSVLNNAVFEGAAIAELLPPWAERFFYTPTSAERAYANSVNGLSMVVPGAGSDIWGASDSFHFVAQPMSGDAEILARVATESNTSELAKAGLMMRSDVGGDVGGGDAAVILDVKPDGGLEFMARTAPGADMQFLAGGTQSFPAWLRLVRTGDQVTGYACCAATGNWELIGSVVVDLSPTGTQPSIGLAVTSREPGAINTAVFQNIAVNQGR